MEKETPSKKQITGFGLKMIALVTMTIDHFAAIVLERISGTSTLMYNIYFALRCIGRLAFPLFIFLLVEGFMHTHSKKRYAVRLFLFAFIAEVPFNLAFSHEILYPTYQNVFFTLLLGFLGMMFSSFIHEKNVPAVLGYISVILSSAILGAYLGICFINFASNFGRDYTDLRSIIVICALTIASVAIVLIYMNLKNSFLALSQCALSLFVATLLAVFADVFMTDYGSMGVFAIMVAYAFKDKKTKSFALSVVPLVFSSYIEIFALLDLPLIRRYNGQKGKSMKYFFYAYYPCHLLILTLIADFLFPLG